MKNNYQREDAKVKVATRNEHPLHPERVFY